MQDFILWVEHTIKLFFDMQRFCFQTVISDETIDSICVKQPKALFGSKSDCHQYYNCSGTDSQLSVPPGPSYNYWTIQHKHECHYPFMFSEDTLQCENYTEVSCGRRYKPTWECEHNIFIPIIKRKQLVAKIKIAKAIVISVP